MSIATKLTCSGLGVIFEKLQQGCAENEELLSLALARAEAENIYGAKLIDIRNNHASKKEGFARDEGATVRKAYEGIVTEMGEEGKHHMQVAESLRVMVLNPFRRWTEEHKTRVEYSYDFLRTKVKVHEQEASETDKLKKKYFSKCRQLDEILETQESTDPGTAPPAKEAAPPPPKEEALATPLKRSDTVVYDDEKFEPVELGGEPYNARRLKSLLLKMLTEIPQKEVKVPIIGTYEHVSTGANIVSWLQKSATGGDVTLAEQFGQDLITSNYLRLVGQVGSKFLNSSQLNYQWKKLAYVRAGLEKAVPRDQSTASSIVGEYFGSINNYLNNQFPDDTPLQKVEKEVKELDSKYKESVIRYDDARCSLEESIVEHLNFMERCETDRLKAVKQVLLDFLAPVSNISASVQASVDKYLLYQETVKPESDLLHLVESYKTGGFSPKAPVYDNFYNTAEGWTFGVDLELRARGDGKRVPLIVSTILRYLDNQYPVIENDELRLGVWSTTAPLKRVHELRKELNNGLPVDIKTLEKYQPAEAASTLKLYFKELPESVVPSAFYDAIKTIYVEHGNDEDPKVRLQLVQSLCGQLNPTQLSILDALTKHLGRLLEIANPSQEIRDKLALELSSSILRPNNNTAALLFTADKHPQLFVRDLLEHRRAILTELKRAVSGSVPRAGSRAASAAATAALKSSEVNKDHAVTLRPAVEAVAPSTLDGQKLKVRMMENTIEEPESAAPAPVTMAEDVNTATATTAEQPAAV